MHARQTQALARLQAIAACANSHKPHGAPAVFFGSIVALEKSNERLEALSQEQSSTSARGVKNSVIITTLRKQLRRGYMIPLSRAMGTVLRFAPRVESARAVPHARAKHTEVVTAAERMLTALTPHRRLLTQTGFPKETLGEMRRLTRELKQQTIGASDRQKRYAKATRELGEELARASRVIHLLEGLAITIGERDPSFLASWKRAARMPKPRGRPKQQRRGRRAAPPVATAPPGSLD